MEEIKSINIPAKIFILIEQKIKDPLIGFETVEDYVKFVLTKALDIKDENEFEDSKSEDEKVEEKLRQLGYI